MPLPGWFGTTRHAAALTASFAIIATTAVAAHLARIPPAPDRTTSWQETEWRIPLDNWGQGRAWHAVAAGGAEILLLARTKSGFCNCFNGIADDTEIDRIGDVDLHGDRFIPEAPGEVASVGTLRGRKRAFQASAPWNRARHVLSIVAASDCKAVVATLVSNETISPDAETSAVAQLTTGSFLRWVADQQ